MQWRRSPWQRIQYLLFHIPQSLRLAWRLLRDRRVPAANKGLLVLLSLLYLALPVDLIPDYIPLVGPLDDVGVILFLMNQFIRLAPANVVAEYMELK